MSAVSIADLVRERKVEEIAPALAETAPPLRRQHEGAPWFVQLALAVGLFLSSGLVCGGLGDIIDEQWLLGAAGLLLLAISSLTSWLPLPWVARPAVLASVLLGRLLFGAGFADDELPYIMAALEATLWIVHRDPLNRLIAAVSVPLWLRAEIEVEGIAAMLSLLSLLVGCTLLLLRRHWVALWVREILHPLALGALAAALILPTVPGESWGVFFPLLVGILCSGCALAVALSLGLRPLEVSLAALLPVCVAAMTWPVPGLTVALLVAVTGFLTRSRALWGCAVAAVAMYGARAMYQLDWSLWAKGSAMIGAGILLMWMGQLAGRVYGRR